MFSLKISEELIEQDTVNRGVETLNSWMLVEAPAHENRFEEDVDQFRCHAVRDREAMVCRSLDDRVSPIPMLILHAFRFG